MPGERATVQLEQEFEIPSGADRVWHWFHDIEAVVACLPGASLQAPPDDGRLRLAMVVKLGPIVANFVGDGAVTFNDATRSGTVSGAAADKKSGSRIKGQVAFVVSERPESPTSMTPTTHVALTIGYAMGGTLAQFSREGIVRDLAQRMTDAFALNLRRKLELADAITPAVTPPSHADATAVERTIVPEPAVAPALDRTPAPPAAALNLGALLWTAFVERIKRLFTTLVP